MEKFEELQQEADFIQSFLEEQLPTEINACVERLSLLAGYLARSGDMLAEAKKLMRRKKSDEICNMVADIAKKACLSSKAQNALVDSVAVEEMYLVDKIDRINATCTHQGDWCRSIISKEKEEMKFASYTQKNNN